VAEARAPLLLSLPARLEEGRRISEALSQAASEAGLSQGEFIDLDLAVAEAANNIVLHGYGRDETNSFQVLIQVEEGRLSVELSDSGRPIPAPMLEAASPAPWDAECGRGFGIIHACVDALTYRSEGGLNRLTLVKNRGSRAAVP
jgi:serine/threonine-protein kinase RsbW